MGIRSVPSFGPWATAAKSEGTGKKQPLTGVSRMVSPNCSQLPIVEALIVHYTELGTWYSVRVRKGLGVVSDHLLSHDT